MEIKGLQHATKTKLISDLRMIIKYVTAHGKQFRKRVETLQLFVAALLLLVLSCLEPQSLGLKHRVRLAVIHCSVLYIVIVIFLCIFQSCVWRKVRSEEEDLVYQLHGDYGVLLS